MVVASTDNISIWDVFAETTPFPMFYQDPTDYSMYLLVLIPSKLIISGTLKGFLEFWTPLGAQGSKL